VSRETVFTAVWIIGVVIAMAWQGPAGVALYMLGFMVAGAGSVVNAQRRHSA
jgi:hypothetical protein